MTKTGELDSRISAVESEMVSIKETGLITNQRLEVLEGSLLMMRDQLLQAMQQMQDKLVLLIEAKLPKDRSQVGAAELVKRSKGDDIPDLESAMKGDELVADESEANINSGEALEIDDRFNGETSRVSPVAVVVGDVSEKRFVVDNCKPQEEEEEVKLELEANLVEKQKRTESTGEGVELDLNTQLPIVVSHAVTGQDLHGEELARAFQKLVSKMARDVQSAVWVLGLKGQLEPEFLLVTGGEEFGSEVGPDLDLLGPPPWYDSALKEFGLTSYQILGVDSTNGGFGSFLNLMGPFCWPNSVYQTTKGEQKLSGLSVALMGPPPCEIKKATYSQGSHLQPTDICSSRCLTEHTQRNCERKSLIPSPPARPPPQPPDLFPMLPRLEFISTSLVYPAVSCPNFPGSNGKVDAAGDDPGDIQWVHWCPPALKFKHRLEGKAVFKGLARAWIGSHVKEWGFTLDQLEQSVDPLFGSLPCNIVFTDITKSAHLWLGGREDVASIDPGNTPEIFSSEFESDLKGADSKPAEERKTIGQLVWGIIICLFKWDNRQPREVNAAENQMLETFYHSLRPPEFVDKRGGPLKVRRESDWALRLKREGSLVEEFIILLLVPVEPPSHPLYDLVSVLVVTRDCRKLSGRVDAGGDDPGDDPTLKVQSRLFPGAIGKAYFGSYGAYACISQSGTNHHRRPSRHFTELIQEDTKPISKLTQSVEAAGVRMPKCFLCI